MHICSGLWSQHCIKHRRMVQSRKVVQPLDWQFFVRSNAQCPRRGERQRVVSGKQQAMITLRSICNALGTPYAKRFLIEPDWPQDPDRLASHLEGLLRDIAPSCELRAWFASDQHKWQEFRRRYFAEMDSCPEAWRFLVEEARGRTGIVELLYNSHDPKHNNAVALKEYLDLKLAAAMQPV